MNNYSRRYAELNAIFQLGKDTHLPESNIEIQFYSFHSDLPDADNETKINNSADVLIAENLSFVYPVFIPTGMSRTDKAILLLHGLNERNWGKYLTWAEYLCKQTGKPVILFPLAFHMNRSPSIWTNPRAMKHVMDLRQIRNGEDRSMSIANVALSERICEKPYRFYSSGRQSMFDLSQLAGEIKQGKHALFGEDTHIDIFAYSIGAFLSQITLMANPHGLFTGSKLFMFCGGSIFSSMFGVSRSIMDKEAFQRLLKYYLNEFEVDTGFNSSVDKGYESFFSMISPERKQPERESFFKKLGNSISGISLGNDKVIPYSGVQKAMGLDCASRQIKLLDFPFSYSHENPFPVDLRNPFSGVDSAFIQIFSQAAGFLA